MPRTEDFSVRVANEEDVVDLAILGRKFSRESKNAYLGWSSTKVHNSLLDALSRDDFLVLALETEDEVVGMFIGFIAPCFFSDAEQASEIVWYVSPEHRGSKEAYKMLILFEDWADTKGAACINMVNLDVLNADKVAKMYTKRGYRLAENTFVKEL